jgi:hypothetical protein
VGLEGVGVERLFGFDEAHVQGDEAHAVDVYFLEARSWERLLLAKVDEGLRGQELNALCGRFIC